MFAFFVMVLLVSVAVAIVAFVFLDGITLKELGCQFLAQLAIAGIAAGIVSCANTSDVEVWNGAVTGKEQVYVPCSHSYQCNCVAVSCGKDCSTTVCSTCYDHPNDWDWDVYTSNGETIEIERLDRQGFKKPPRWTAVKVGEPTTTSHTYVNYVKASPDSLFRHQGLAEKHAKTLPEYPGKVYDYYRLDHYVHDGSGSQDAEWNRQLARINAELGKKKQANVIVVKTYGRSPEWFYALEEKWVGGKKNDIVIVIDEAGFREPANGAKPQWVEVMAWTSNEMLKVKLRDDIMALDYAGVEQAIPVIEHDVDQYYVRKPMKDFEYLKASMVPSTTQWTVTLIVSLVAAVGLTWFFQVNDVFNEEGRGGGYMGTRMPFDSRLRTWKEYVKGLFPLRRKRRQKRGA